MRGELAQQRARTEGLSPGSTDTFSQFQRVLRIPPHSLPSTSQGFAQAVHPTPGTLFPVLLSLWVFLGPVATSPGKPSLAPQMGSRSRESFPLRSSMLKMAWWLACPPLRVPVSVRWMNE